MKESLFDNFDFDEDGSNEEEECPACGVIASIDGPTEGCYDPNGCGKDLRDLEEEMEADDDDEVEELNFD